MILATEIRKRRRALDLTQSELAKQVGCHPVRIYDWERGETSGIETRNLVALERALKCSPGDLLKAYCADIDEREAVTHDHGLS